jgi:hypothetical protein
VLRAVRAKDYCSLLCIPAVSMSLHPSCSGCMASKHNTACICIQQLTVVQHCWLAVVAVAWRGGCWQSPLQAIACSQVAWHWVLGGWDAV